MSLNVFSNREIATAAWATLVLGWMLPKRGFRQSLFGLLRTLLKWKALLPLLTMASYTYAVTSCLAELGLWAPSQTKDTVFWFLASGVALMIAVVDQGKQADFWRGAALDQLKALVIIEALGAESSFSLVTEMLFVPFLISLAAMRAVASLRKEFAGVEKHVTWMLAIVALVLLGRGLGTVAGYIATGGTGAVVRSLALEPMLTIALLPFLYAYMIAVMYDEFRWRIGFKNPAGHRFARHASSRIILRHRLNLSRLHGFLRANALALLGLADEIVLSRLLDTWYREGDGATAG